MPISKSRSVCVCGCPHVCHSVRFTIPQAQRACRAVRPETVNIPAIDPDAESGGYHREHKLRPDLAAGLAWLSRFGLVCRADSMLRPLGYQCDACLVFRSEHEATNPVASEQFEPAVE
eukprot:4356578-Amphidinium_carterae.1